MSYRRFKLFDVLKINDKEKLIVLLKPEKTNKQYYVNNDELVSLQFETHIRIGQEGRRLCLKICNRNTKNIAY